MDRNEKLIHFCESVKNNSNVLNSEAENEIVQLNIKIDTQNNRIEENFKKCKAIEESTQAGALKHFNIVAQMEHQFEVTRRRLHAELKYLSEYYNI